MQLKRKAFLILIKATYQSQYIRIIELKLISFATYFGLDVNTIVVDADEGHRLIHQDIVLAQLRLQPLANGCCAACQRYIA